MSLIQYNKDVNSEMTLRSFDRHRPNGPDDDLVGEIL